MKSPIKNFPATNLLCLKSSRLHSHFCLTSTTPLSRSGIYRSNQSRDQEHKATSPQLCCRHAAKTENREYEKRAQFACKHGVLIRSVIFGCPLKNKKGKKIQCLFSIASQLSYAVPLPELDVKPVLSDVLDESAHKFHTLTSLLSCPDQASFP